MSRNALFDLSGKVALITGSSKGMGRSMAEGLAEHGARVVISSRKLEQCQATADEINAHCGAGSAIAVACNAGRKDELHALVDTTHERLGAIDISIGNAGVNPFYGSIMDIPDEAFDKTLSTNVKANLWLAQMVAPDMKAKGGGSIMITSSTGALRPSDTLGSYSVSKLADLALVRNLALELGPFGIRVNAICPGLVKTDFARALWDNPESERRVQEEVPLRRLGAADDLKGVAVFLASDASSYMTGQALTLCGGTHMWA
ncbi:MAG: SDR family oxidoreductase [Gammaproteobacteria bacterium]|nr:SDR family oxidoreductase [Gammaproteobacteria bacterium]MCY4199162.1 SDR family oxidoreductase [Gammaproteobacteria bacterium]MCY4276782.1 SDR family oxidoreductase [Gammaproteobacteria bacterium]MCY4322078.1 SDR family oxidoreductase [Gammaproteobacteria bacterium]